MVAFQGMDVEAIRSVATGLNGQSVELVASIGRIDALVNQLASAWNGPDVHQFAAWWQQEHRPRLVSAADAVRGLGESAANNASEQAAASAGTGAGGSGGGAATAFVSSPPANAADLQRMKDLHSWASDVLGPTMPKTDQKIEEWFQRLSQGHPSAAEVAAFGSFVQLAMLANGQRFLVRQNGELAQEAYNGAVTSLVGVAGAKGGKLPSAVKDQILKGLGDGAGGFIKSHLASSGANILSSDIPDKFVAQYDAQADDYLSGLDDGSRASTDYQASMDVRSDASHAYLDSTNSLRTDEQKLDWATLVTGHDDAVSSLAVGLRDLWAPARIVDGATNGAVAGAELDFVDRAVDVGLVDSLSSLRDASTDMGFRSR